MREMVGNDITMVMCKCREIEIQQSETGRKNRATSKVSRSRNHVGVRYALDGIAPHRRLDIGRELLPILEQLVCGVCITQSGVNSSHC